MNYRTKLAAIAASDAFNKVASRFRNEMREAASHGYDIGKSLDHLKSRAHTAYGQEGLLSRYGGSLKNLESASREALSNLKKVQMMPEPPTGHPLHPTWMHGRALLDPEARRKALRSHVDAVAPRDRSAVNYFSGYYDDDPLAVRAERAALRRLGLR